MMALYHSLPRTAVTVLHSWRHKQ